MRVVYARLLAGFFMAGILAACTTDSPPSKPQPIAAQDCYIDFIDDHSTAVSLPLQKGWSDTLGYTIGPDVSNKTRGWIADTMAELDRIIAVDVVRGEGNPQINFVMDGADGRRAETRRDGTIALANIGGTSGGRERGLRTIAHEVGHALGLSHPGHDPDGTRPDDWHTTGDDPTAPGFWRDGMNTHSDHRVKRPDGTGPLDDHDTVMAFLTHADALDGPLFKWMDVQALRNLYGTNEAMPGVRHFSGDGGTCN